MEVRAAVGQDVEAICGIYNQGIADRMATLESEPKDAAYIEAWLAQHQGRYRVFVICEGDKVVGWASLHPYSMRDVYAGVGEVSIYVSREYRGQGVGQVLLMALEGFAREQHFHKLVLGTFSGNVRGRALYARLGFQEVGTFRNHGMLDGHWVDVLWMEKLLTVSVCASDGTQGTASKSRAPLTLRTVQRYIRRKDHNPAIKLSYFQKLVEEVGELAKAMRHPVLYRDTGSVKGTVDEELYDVLYYAVALANLYDVDLETTMRVKEPINAVKYGQTDVLRYLDGDE